MTLVIGFQGLGRGVRRSGGRSQISLSELAGISFKGKKEEKRKKKEGEKKKKETSTNKAAFLTPGAVLVL